MRNFYTGYEYALYDWLKETNFQNKARIKLPKKPNFLGEGTQGFALAVSPTKAIKITQDESEAKLASFLSGNKIRGLYSADGAWKPKNPFAIGSKKFLPYNLYVIVMERLVDNLSLADKVVNAIESARFTAYIRSRSAPHHSSFWTDDVLERAEEYDGWNQSIVPYVLDIAYGMNYLNKNNIKYDDLHVHNVLFTKSKHAVLIDIGYTQFSSGKLGLIE